ncbi:MAG TPA: hypothetical protein ENH55_02430 [Aurantimonas coralicida]|uniref:Uncharacterized protein n=2 Tax=root TaxID=1 RepID=A0A9C9NH78_9HYPH|nr:hypothetical protein [Aurantimonas coralicida]HEU01198.1 hypothetical protein [Aurantimonas coralicida]
MQHFLADDVDVTISVWTDSSESSTRMPMTNLKHPLQAIGRLLAAALFCVAVLSSQLAHASPHTGDRAFAALIVDPSVAEVAEDHVASAANDAASDAKPLPKATGDKHNDHCPPASMPDLLAEYHLDWPSKWGLGWHVVELVGSQVPTGKRPPRA